MTTIQELNPHNYETTPVLDKNLSILFDRLMEFQESSEFSFHINSGLRNDAQQAELIKEGKTNAVHSKHLIGAAADINDPDGKLAEWVKENLPVVERIGLWFEDFGHTHGWVHAQCTPPGSGKRVFIP